MSKQATKQSSREHKAFLQKQKQYDKAIQKEIKKLASTLSVADRLLADLAGMGTLAQFPELLDQLQKMQEGTTENNTPASVTEEQEKNEN